MHHFYKEYENWDLYSKGYTSFLPLKLPTKKMPRKAHHGPKSAMDTEEDDLNKSLTKVDSMTLMAPAHEPTLNNNKSTNLLVEPRRNLLSVQSGSTFENMEVGLSVGKKEDKSMRIRETKMKKQLCCKALGEISEEVQTSRINKIYALSKHSQSLFSDRKKPVCFGERVNLKQEDRQKVQEISAVLK